MTQSLERLLRSREFEVYPADSEVRPDLLAAHRRYGLLAVDVVLDAVDARLELNRRVDQLRQDIGELMDAKISRRVVELGSAGTNKNVLTLEEALSGQWIEELPERPLPDEVFDNLARRIAPEITFISPRRGVLLDPESGARAERRVVLDAQQAGVATSEFDDILQISGPPGSGKTLVLAARARWLSEHHADWRIQLLCYNRLLVPYLRSLVAGCPNVSVSTFGKFAYELGFRIDLSDEARSDADVARALRNAFPCVDAYLVDEWQDFFPSWVTLLQATLMPRRGGILLAGDARQALYRDAQLEEDAAKRVRHVTLSHPYRSTRPILDVTSALGADFQVDGRAEALDGEPVDLVWASSHKEQANAVARDILLILEAGDRTPENIAVLYTRRFQLGAICHALENAHIPFEVAQPATAGALSLATPTVKVMTVHSAKGYEFDVVFLVGLEQLPDPDGTIAAERQGRTGYVGMTRARDQLVITYSKDNQYLESIRSIPEALLRRWVWPDDYPEA